MVIFVSQQLAEVAVVSITNFSTEIDLFFSARGDLSLEEWTEVHEYLRGLPGSRSSGYGEEFASCWYSDTDISTLRAMIETVLHQLGVAHAVQGYLNRIWKVSITFEPVLTPEEAQALREELDKEIPNTFAVLWHSTCDEITVELLVEPDIRFYHTVSAVLQGT